MHTRSDPAQTRYRKLYRLGYWCCQGAYFKIPGGQIMEIGVEFEI
jgi:hypothetical protein